MRVLAVDFGFSRIGIAVGESAPVAFSARPAVKASGALKKDAQAISDLARKEEADLLLVGLPVEPSGEEGRMERICRTLAKHLQNLGWTVELVDESQSSLEAETRLREYGVRDHHAVHGEAAIVILERYLNAQAPA